MMKKLIRPRKKQIIFRRTFTSNSFAFQKEKCSAESAAFGGGRKVLCDLQNTK
jgi:hypothetical protein